MLYGTGGVAWGKIEYSGAASLNDPLGFIYSANTSFSRTAVGWTAGAGLEWMITDHWLLRGEYLFYNLSSSQHMDSNNPLIFHGACINRPLSTSRSNHLVFVGRHDRQRGSGSSKLQILIL
jgi:outer membrane immunogenic protein